LRHAVDQRQERPSAQGLAEIGVGLGALAEAGHLFRQDIGDVVVDPALLLQRSAIDHADRAGGLVDRCLRAVRRLEHEGAQFNGFVFIRRLRDGRKRSQRSQADGQGPL
jgi:hypothetical protein